MLKKLCLAHTLATALLILGLFSNVQTHSSDEVVAVYGITPAIDGTITTGEWDDASTVTFSVTDGTCTVYVKQNGSHLHVAFDVPDATHWAGEGSHVFLDVDHNGGEYPQTDDLWLIVHRAPPGALQEEHHGTGNIWEWIPDPVGWNAARSYTEDGYQTEYSIPYSKISVTAGVDKTLGVAFMTSDNVVGDGWIDYGWPSGVNRDVPNTWANLTSGDPYFWVPENPLTFAAVALMLTFAVIAYPCMRKRQAR